MEVGLCDKTAVGQASGKANARTEEDSVSETSGQKLGGEAEEDQDEEEEALMARWGNALGGWKRQKRNARGQFTSTGAHKALRAKGGGFVPYRRHGLGHNTFGVNAGLGVTKNRRVSFGFYVRTDTKSGQKKAMKIAKAQEHAQLLASRGIPDAVAETRGGKLMATKRIQNRAMREATGGETRKITGEKVRYSRIGTDRNSLPTYIVRYNSPKDKTKGSYNKRNKSIATYNVKSVTGKRTFDWTQKPVNRRPQRRKKASRG